MEEPTMGQLMSEIEHYSQTYQFIFQFWGSGNNNVYIEKDGTELWDYGSGETIKDILIHSLQYIYRINNIPENLRVC